MEQISDVVDVLTRLEVENMPSTLPETVGHGKLQIHLHILHKMVNDIVEQQTKELDDWTQSLNHLIGVVRASSAIQTWRETSLRTHLAGISRGLRNAEKNLLTRLRSEVRRIAEELLPGMGPDVDWAISWRLKRKRCVRNWDKLVERANLFNQRVQALNQWDPCNDALGSTEVLCKKIRISEPVPISELNQLVDDFRERFATKHWEPVFESDEFSNRLTSVQKDVQLLLYRYSQAHFGEVEHLTKHFQHLVPQSDTPRFDPDRDGVQRFDSVYESFQELYRWTIKGFHEAIADYRRHRDNGARWSHPINTSTTWKDLNGQIANLLSSLPDILDFSTVQDIGTRLNQMRLGLDGAQSITSLTERRYVTYDNPQNPPDFKEMSDLYGKGQIVIRVDRRR